MCHLLGCCKAHVVPWVWRADYAAIVLFIVTSYVAPLYYSLVCKPTLRLFYLATTVALGRLLDLTRPDFPCKRLGLTVVSPKGGPCSLVSLQALAVVRSMLPVRLKCVSR